MIMALPFSWSDSGKPFDPTTSQDRKVRNLKEKNIDLKMTTLMAHIFLHLSRPGSARRHRNILLWTSFQRHPAKI
jgi:hypothetical protein